MANFNPKDFKDVEKVLGSLKPGANVKIPDGRVFYFGTSIDPKTNEKGYFYTEQKLPNYDSIDILKQQAGTYIDAGGKSNSSISKDSELILNAFFPQGSTSNTISSSTSPSTQSSTSPSTPISKSIDLGKKTIGGKTGNLTLGLSYDSKSKRINDLIETIFKDVSKDDIKVGLIDPVLGYVVDVSVCEANDHAKNNPGTTFIFKDAKNSVKYLNINEINALVPESLISDKSDCTGIQTRKKCDDGPPKIQFIGGGGVGAQANAIVGIDGKILAIDVITGGFGYRYPPLVRAIDECQYGSGAVLVSELGEVVETYETFDDEDDFEDYEICPDTAVGYGRNWGPNGEDLGPWEPSSYTRIGGDPIRNEIIAYQKSLSKLSNPFWTTKSTPPKSITAPGKKYDVPYVVTDSRWNEFMNVYAISPVPPSNVSGTDEAGKLFVFNWDVNFPHDGEYIFRGLCDNVATLYVDNQKLFDLGTFIDAVKPINKQLTKGLHNIRIDLLNLPILEDAKPVAPVVPVAPTSPTVLVDTTTNTIRTAIEPGIYLDLTQYRADEEVYCNFGTLFTDGPSLNIPEVGIVEGRTDGFAGKAITVGPGARPLGGDFGGEVFLKGGRLYGPITIVPNPEYKQSDLFIGMSAGAVNDANVELNFNTSFGGNQSWVPYITHIQSLTGRGAEGEGSGFAGALFQESLNAFAIVDKFRPEDPDNNNYTPIKYEGVTSFTLTTQGGFFRRITQTIITSTPISTPIPLLPVAPSVTAAASAPSTIQNQNIFNTVDYISKANRTLWRTNPTASLTSSLLDRYGVCPFDTSPTLLPTIGASVTINNQVWHYGLTQNGPVFTTSSQSDYNSIDTSKPGSYNDPFSLDNRYILDAFNATATNISNSSVSFSYAGTHTIIWNNINFPITGNYRIQIAVDDNVSLYITDSTKNTEILIRKEGFSAPGKRNPDSDDVYTFTQGNYTIRAELEQLDVGTIASGNSMILAVNIETTSASVIGGFVSPKSFNENPMGISVTIEAPPLPVPKEPIPVQTGRCPPNPIWSTRFPSNTSSSTSKSSTISSLKPGTSASVVDPYSKLSRTWFYGLSNGKPTFTTTTQKDYNNVDPLVPGLYADINNINNKYILDEFVVNTTSTPTNSSSTSKDQWYPVVRTTGEVSAGTAWSKFMNRYAISPVPPFDTDNTDRAGVNFINTWTVELPYRGFYGVRGTADNSGRVLIDGKEVSKLDPFTVSNPRLEKVLLEKGTHEIAVEVFNAPIERAFDIPIKVFSTRDWEVSVPFSGPSISSIVLIDMLRYYTPDFSGDAGATHFFTTDPIKEIIDPNQLSLQGTAWKMFKIGTTNVPDTVPLYRLFYGGDHLYTISGSEKSSLESGAYSFEGIVGYVYSQPGPDRIEVFRFYRPPGVGGSGPIPGEHFYTADTNEISTLSALGYASEGIAFYAPTAIPNAAPVNTTGTPAKVLPLFGAGSANGDVIYDGPTLASYVPGTISPLFQNTLTPTEEIQGKTWGLAWQNVDFPEDGKYILNVLADDLVIVRIDGIEVGRAKVSEDKKTFFFNATKGKKVVQLELVNSRIPGTSFKENPVYTFVEIIKNTVVNKIDPLPWTVNPIGVSAILIPPPCPKLVKGKGVIKKVFVEDPGNSYSCPPGLKLNPITGKCEPPPTQCPVGQTLDLKTGQCINLCDTSKGEVYDPITKKCIKPPIDCPSGQVYDPVTQKCVDLPPNPCPPGQILNKITGKCETAPPCPSGEVRNPITGKCEPIPSGTPPSGTPASLQPAPGYPVCLIIDEVLVENSGINYNCGVDKLQIVPDNGVILDYVCDSFGRIVEVKILDNGTCFPEYPSITMVSDTGVNASFRPVFRVVRDPIDPALTRDNQKLIRVTDLVGLTQTGYIDGRAYYGAVFYENGIRYAGYYKTVGTLIRVYDTLQESITAEVTTAPSAIEKSGTNINSNNPGLNIPGTPTNLI